MLVDTPMRAGPGGGHGHWAPPSGSQAQGSGWSAPTLGSDFSSSARQPRRGLHVWVAAARQVAGGRQELLRLKVCPPRPGCVESVGSELGHTQLVALHLHSCLWGTGQPYAWGLGLVVTMPPLALSSSSSSGCALWSPPLPPRQPLPGLIVSCSLHLGRQLIYAD